MIRNCLIYGLIDPRNPCDIRYVGITRHTLSRRLQGHRRLAKSEKPSKKDEWIMELKSAGVRPAILLLDFAILSQAAKKEREWIERYRIGGKLLNGGFISSSVSIKEQKCVVFREKLLNWRGSKTQKEAADILGVPLPTYRNWEYGINEPTWASKKYIIGKIDPGFEGQISD
jgi:DNA-binding XRE family transcriptional regulator